MESSKICSLPNELVLQILRYVSFKDLCSVAEVSRDFYSLATDPLLWRYFEIFHRKAPEKLNTILELKRFSKLATIHLSQGKG